MKNKNLNFSPKKLQTSPGSPEIMTMQYNNEIRQFSYFVSFLICGNLRRFVALSYKLLNVADIIIMHSV